MLDASITFTWVVIGFIALRVLGARFFNQKYRADVVAAAIVLAFVIGTLWPFSNRMGMQNGSAPNSAASAAAEPNKLNLTEAVVSQLRPLEGTNDIGSLDVLQATPNDFARSMAAFQKGSTIYASGWVGDGGAKAPIRGAVLVIDAKIIVDATPLYGQPRPDLARAFGPGMLNAGFLNVPIPTAGLSKGRHVIQAAGVTDDAKGYYLVGTPRVVTVN